jgi:hypothetical protein
MENCIGRWFCLSFLLISLVGCANKTNEVTEIRSYENMYCYNGGRANEYSCDPKLASPQPDMHPDEIDEVWMYTKLWEIKAWLRQLKAEHQKPPQPLYLVEVSTENE